MLAHGVSYHRGGATDVRVGVYHYLYTNPDAVATAIDAGALNGEYKTNRFDPSDATAYFSDYSIVGATVRVVRDALTFVGEVAVNTGAERREGLAAAFESREHIAAGGMITYGLRDRPWSWSVGSGFFHIEADAVLAPYNSDDLQQTNVNTVPIVFQLTLPGGAELVWDTYIQSKIDVNLASNGGLVHDENATKIRTRMTIQARF